MENKERDKLKYTIIYSMILDLLEQGKIDREAAEKINEKCAELLGCRKMMIM